MTATAVALTPTSVAGRWVRRITAAAVAVLGTVDVVAAALSRPPLRAGLLGVDYAVAALVGARYVLLAAGVAALMVVRGLAHAKRLPGGRLCLPLPLRCLLTTSSTRICPAS